MSLRSPLLTCLLVSLSLAVSLPTRARAYPKSVRELVGRRAPQVRARSLRRKTPLSLGPFRGRALLLVFFATWCRPCRAIEPVLEALVRRLGPKRITLLALSHERHARLLPGLRPRPAGYIVAQCTGRTALRYSARSVPTLVLIDGAGTVRAAWQGLKPHDMPRVLGTVQRIVAARAVRAPQSPLRR